MISDICVKLSILIININIFYTYCSLKRSEVLLDQSTVNILIPVL